MLHLHLLVNDCFLAAAAGLHALWLNSAFVQCDLASCPPTGRLTSHTWPFLCWAHELSSSRCWTYCHNWRTVSACLRSVGLLTQSFVFYVCFMRGSSPCWQILFLPSASFSWLHLSISDTLLLMITSWFLSPICSQVSRPFSTCWIIFRISASVKSCLLPCLSWYFLWVFFTLQSATKFYQNCVPSECYCSALRSSKTSLWSVHRRTSLCIYICRHVYNHV